MWRLKAESSHVRAEPRGNAAAKVTAPYDTKVPDGLLPAGATGTSADRFVSMVYSQLKSQ